MLLWHGQIPFCHSLMFKKFLHLLNHSIKACVKGWSRNSCWIYILWQWESYLMGKKNIRWCPWRYEGKSFKMFKIKSFWKKISYFQLVFRFFLACPLLGGNFHRDNPNRIWTFYPVMRDVRYCTPPFKGFFTRNLY